MVGKICEEMMIEACKLTRGKVLKKTLVFVLVFMVLSCSADTDTRLIFEGDPEINDLPANVSLGQIAGGAPPAKFINLKYENHLLDKASGKTNIPYTSSVKLEARNSPIAVTKTEYFISQPNGTFLKQVTDVDVGVPGLISFIYLTTKESLSQQIQFRKLVKRIENANGKLFPLDKASLLSFDIVFAYQATRGNKATSAGELRWSYEFRKIGHYEGYNLPGHAVPGKIYIIARWERDPEGSVDKTLIHFAEAIGAVIKTVRQGKNFLEETRLVGMTD